MSGCRSRTSAGILWVFSAGGHLSGSKSAAKVSCCCCQHTSAAALGTHHPFERAHRRPPASEARHIVHACLLRCVRLPAKAFQRPARSRGSSASHPTAPAMHARRRGSRAAPAGRASRYEPAVPRRRTCMLHAELGGRACIDLAKAGRQEGRHAIHDKLSLQGNGNRVVPTRPRADLAVTVAQAVLQRRTSTY